MKAPRADRDPAKRELPSSGTSSSVGPGGSAQFERGEQSHRRDMHADPRNGPEGSYRGSESAAEDAQRAPALPSDEEEPEGFARRPQDEQHEDDAR